VDLPAGRGDAGLAEYAEVVLAAVEGCASSPIVVAQSLGGFTGPLVCSRAHADLLVLVNAMIPLPGETPGQWWAATGQAEARRALADREGRATPDDPFDDFFHDVTAAAIAQGAPAQSGTPFGQPLRIDRWSDTPTKVVVGVDDRFFPADFQIRVAGERLGIAADVIPGGHLFALSQPKALADRLEAYRGSLTASGDDARS
jgi:hypothetical protein